MYTLLRSIIVESNGQVEIIPAGTIIEALEDPDKTRRLHFFQIDGQPLPFGEMEGLTPVEATKAVMMTKGTDAVIEIYVDLSKGEPNIGLVFQNGAYTDFGLGNPSPDPNKPGPTEKAKSLFTPGQSYEPKMLHKMFRVMASTD